MAYIDYIENFYKCFNTSVLIGFKKKFEKVQSIRKKNIFKSDDRKNMEEHKKEIKTQ